MNPSPDHFGARMWGADFDEKLQALRVLQGTDAHTFAQTAEEVYGKKYRFSYQRLAATDPMLLYRMTARDPAAYATLEEKKARRDRKLARQGRQPSGVSHSQSAPGQSTS